MTTLYPGRYFRYVDDVVIVVHDTKVGAALDQFRSLVAAEGLVVNEAKTDFVAAKQWNTHVAKREKSASRRPGGDGGVAGAGRDRAAPPPAGGRVRAVVVAREAGRVVVVVPRARVPVPVPARAPAAARAAPGVGDEARRGEPSRPRLVAPFAVLVLLVAFVLFVALGLLVAFGLFVAFALLPLPVAAVDRRGGGLRRVVLTVLPGPQGVDDPR
jgi:hypothetical protein